MRKIFILLLTIIFIFTTSSFIWCETGKDTVETLTACDQAQKDAENDTNQLLWFGIGCLTGAIGPFFYFYQVP